MGNCVLYKQSPLALARAHNRELHAQALNEKICAMEAIVADAEARESMLAEKMRVTVKDLVTRRLDEHKRCLELSSQLTAAHESHAQLNNSLAAEKATMAWLTSQLQTARESAGQTACELNTREAEVDVLRLQVSQKGGDLKSSQTSLLEREDTIQQLRISASEAQVTSAVALLDHTSQISSLTVQCSELQACIASLEAQLADKSVEVESTSQSLQKSEERVTQLEIECATHAAIQKQAADLQVELHSLQTTTAADTAAAHDDLKVRVTLWLFKRPYRYTRHAGNGFEQDVGCAHL